MANSSQSQSQIQPTTTAFSSSDSNNTLDPALHEACVSGNLDLLTSLLSPSSSSSSSTKPPTPSPALLSKILYVSAAKNHPNIVEWALSHGATLDSPTLQVMLINRSRDVFEYLLTSPAQPTATSSDPAQPKPTPKLDINTYIPWWGDILSNVARRNDLEWTSLCLHHGANPNLHLVDEHKSLLAAVAELSSVEIARLLIERGGAQVKGSGAIVMAAEEGKLDMVKLLLDKGADVNEVGIEHPTDPRFHEDVGSALHRAVWAGKGEMVRFLLGVEGVDLTLKDGLGRTAMQIAEEGGDIKIAELLRKKEKEREREREREKAPQ